MSALQRYLGMAVLKEEGNRDITTVEKELVTNVVIHRENHFKVSVVITSEAIFNFDPQLNCKQRRSGDRQ